LSDATLRLGLVGVGPRGRDGWLRSIPLVPRASLTAICDRHVPSLDAAARRSGLPLAATHNDVDDLLDRSDVDAVVVCVAPEDQARIATQCLDAGKPVLCEVPLCYTIDDCWLLVTAAERAGLPLALAEQVCHAGFVNAWRAMVERGDLGRPLYAEAEYLHGMPSSWYWTDRRDGSRLEWEDAIGNPHAERTRFWTLTHPAWYNPHSLSPLLRVLEDRVETVSCLSTGAPSTVRESLPVADVEVATARTVGGVVLRITTGFVAPTPHPWHWYRILGSEGEVQTSRISEDGVPDGSGLLWHARDGSPVRRRATWSNADYQRNAAQASSSGHQGLDYSAVEDFVEAVLDGTPPAVDVYRAAEIAAAGILAGESAEQGGVALALPDVRPGARRRAGDAPPR
jgi:predicted dehydrogenase